MMRKLILIVLISAYAICMKAQVDKGNYVVDSFNVTIGDFVISETAEPYTFLRIYDGSMSVSFKNYPAVSLILKDCRETSEGCWTYTTVDPLSGVESRMEVKDGKEFVIYFGEDRKDTFTCHYLGPL